VKSVICHCTHSVAFRAKPLKNGKACVREGKESERNARSLTSLTTLTVLAPAMTASCTVSSFSVEAAPAAETTGAPGEQCRCRTRGAIASGRSGAPLPLHPRTQSATHLDSAHEVPTGPAQRPASESSQSRRTLRGARPALSRQFPNRVVACENVERTSGGVTMAYCGPGTCHRGASHDHTGGDLA
jgi:hypothetical protein